VASGAGSSGAGRSGGAGGAVDDAMSDATSMRSTRLRVRYRPLAGAESGSLALPAGAPNADGQVVVRGVAREIGHRSMRAYYRQKYRPEGHSLGASNPELHALMMQYSAAGVLTNPMPTHGLHGAGAKHERSKAQVHFDKKQFLAQSLTNNTTMNGMKHYKNQSLNF